MTNLSSSDRTGIKALANSLNRARLEADTFSSTMPQAGVYGDIATALKNTIYILIADGHPTIRPGVIRNRVENVYKRLLDGEEYVGAAIDAEQAEREAQVDELMELLEPTTPENTKHDWEPGDGTSLMQTDPDCRICGETKRSAVHF